MTKLISYGKFAIQAALACVFSVVAIILIFIDLIGKGVPFMIGVSLLFFILGAVLGGVTRPVSEKLENAKYDALAGASGVKVPEKTNGSKQKSFIDGFMDDIKGTDVKLNGEELENKEKSVVGGFMDTIDDTKSKLENQKDDIVLDVNSKVDSTQKEISTQKEALTEKQDEGFSISIHAPSP